MTSMQRTRNESDVSAVEEGLWLEEWAEILFGDQPDPVLIHMDGRIAYANLPFGRLVGIDPAKLRGRRPASLYAEGDRAGAVARLRAALHAERPTSVGRQSLQGLDGLTVDVESTLLALPVFDGEQLLLIEVLRPCDAAEGAPGAGATRGIAGH